jgi:hypothetical protein
VQVAFERQGLKSGFHDIGSGLNRVVASYIKFARSEFKHAALQLSAGQLESTLHRPTSAIFTA